MGFPADLHLVAVSGTVLNPADGSPATGSVTFAMPYPLRDGTGHVIVGNAPIVVPLVAGAFTVSLPATDQTQVSPLNWVYTVTINTGTAYTVFQSPLPTSPSTTTLDALVPAVVPPTPGIYLPLLMLGQPLGAASLDGNGHILTAQLPPGSGVASVANIDASIVIGGDASNVTVAVGTVTQAQVAGLGAALTAKTPTARQILTGAGLTGGGDLTADRTLTLTAATGSVLGGIVLAGDLAGPATAPTVPALAGKYVKPGGGIPATDLTAAAQTLLGLASTAVQPGAEAVESVNGHTGTVVLTASDVGLGSVNNTTDLAKPSRPAFPLQSYGYHSASLHPDEVNTASTLQEAFWARVWVPGGFTINKIGTFVKLAGTSAGVGLNGFAISDDAGNLLWSSVNDDTMWQVVGEVSKPVSGMIGGNTAPTGGAWYRCAMSSTNYSVKPTLHYANTSSGVLSDAGGRHAWYLAVATWPATFNPATYGNNTGGYIPLILLG